MVFPAVVASITGNDASPGLTSHVITLPAFALGNRVVVLFGGTASSSGNSHAPLGWTTVTGNAFGGGSPFSFNVWDREMQGGDPATVTITSDVGENGSWICYTIDGSVDSGQNNVVASGISRFPDPTIFTPPWNALVIPTLWIAFYAAGEGASNMTVWPLVDNQLYSRYTPGTPTVNLGMCSLPAFSGSLDPGSFTNNLSNGWLTHTMAYADYIPNAGGGTDAFPARRNSDYRRMQRHQRHGMRRLVR